MSKELDQILAGMPVDFADPAQDFSRTRAQMAPLHGHPVAADTAVQSVELGGVHCAWLSRPSNDPSRGAVVFLHGGAFVSCTLADYLFYAEFIADAAGLPVLIVDYRLAPEHQFPAPLDDCVNAYLGLLDDGHDPRRLILMGDSCGGGMALATVARAHGSGRRTPAGLVSLSGWLDLDTAGYAPGYSGRRDPFVTEGFLRARARDYLGPAGDLHHPWASPARGELGGLPPLLLQVGEVDVCRLDAERLGERAGPAGVDVSVDVIIGGVHGVQGLVGMGVPEAVVAWAAVRRFIDRLLGE
jgi:acetyl esterase/lipase